MREEYQTSLGKCNKLTDCSILFFWHFLNYLLKIPTKQSGKQGTHFFFGTLECTEMSRHNKRSRGWHKHPSASEKNFHAGLKWSTGLAWHFARSMQNCHWCKHQPLWGRKSLSLPSVYDFLVFPSHLQIRSVRLPNSLVINRLKTKFICEPKGPQINLDKASYESSSANLDGTPCCASLFVRTALLQKT